MSNPLLTPHVLPPFASILAEHIVPAIQTLTDQNQQLLAEQLAVLGASDWQSLIAPIEKRDDQLNQAWSPVSHLHSVTNTPELREAYNDAVSLLTAYNTAMGQNAQLFNAYETLMQSADFAQLSQAQQQSIRHALRDFRLAGVNLPENKKQRYGEIRARLSQLTTAFSNNVLDATLGWYKQVLDVIELAGLSDMAVQNAAKVASQKGLDGYVLTLDGPVYLNVMTQAHSRALREEFYTAYMTRASDQGPCAGQWDNHALIDEILQLRQELAQLLGFGHYGELSLATKMATSPAQVMTFLRDLAAKSKPMAAQELAELRLWVEANHGLCELAVWDIPYYSEKLKEAQYAVSQEKLRVYFPLPRVLDGLFATLQTLFGVNIAPVADADVWHPDAQFFALSREGKILAWFYLDVYARDGKKGGAWMGECRVRRATEQGVQLPVAFMVCNFGAPVGDMPSLLTHNEVTTLFHEFGHGLHHMLTQIDVAAVSGINGVAWDAVELPSQFLENWCWQPEVLTQLSGHYQTGEPLPPALLQQMLAAKNFQSALQMLRQIEFALFDMRLHCEYGQAGFVSVQQLLDEVRTEVAAVIPPAFNRFQNGFTHIFAGGYAAGYYSYKWAEVLSADAFAAFEEAGIFDAATGQRFLQEILEKGGSEEAMTLFKNFRGREPSVTALLRHSGIES